jgi:hypothetical protein
MKKRSPSYGQNGQLVHWWVLVHSGLQDDLKLHRQHLQRQVFCSSKCPILIFLFPHDTLLEVGTHKMPTMYLSPKKKSLIQLLQCDFTLGQVLKSRPSQNKYHLALPCGAGVGELLMGTPKGRCHFYFIPNGM